jgi:hypothetical protein
MTDTEAPAGLTTSNSRLNVAINEVPQIASAIIATCGTYVATRQEIAARYAEYEIEITGQAKIRDVDPDVRRNAILCLFARSHPGGCCPTGVCECALHRP